MAGNPFSEGFGFWPLVFAAEGEEERMDVLPLDGHPTYLWALVALVATLHVAAFCYWVLA